jgi:hypothetical protein
VFVAASDMSVGGRLVGGLGGGLIIVVVYWALWRVWRWVLPGRGAAPGDD